MKSMTKGNPLKIILLFAIPLFIGRLFQLFYSIVDTRIVGVTLGENALAAVGSTSTLSDLMIEMMMGITNGFAIIVATCFGAKDEKNLKKSVKATFLLAIGITLFLTAGCLIFMVPILKILNVQADIFVNAKGYITVIMAGLICTAMYNACAGVLRAIGDSVTPLIFLVISTIINIVLDYGFILGFHMGVEGAALATVIAQGVSFVLCLFYMIKKYPQLFLEQGEIKAEERTGDKLFDKELIVKMLKAGISMGFMSAFVSFGTVSLQTAINTLGTDIIVAHVAARKITMIFMLPFGVFGQALATYCGQNMGAGEYKRIRDGMLQTIYLTFGWCVLIIIIANLCASNLIHMITGSSVPEVLRNGGLYLRFDTAFYFVPTLIALIRNSLQGIGDVKTPVVSSFIEFFGKLLIAILLVPQIKYWGIIVAEPIVWILMVIPLIVQFFKNPVIKKGAEKSVK